MSFCGWLKIFKRRKHAAVGSEESDERTSSAAKSGVAGRKKTPGSGSSDRTAANGSERNAKNAAGTDEVKVKNGDESDVDDDFWATPVEEAKADENDEGNPRNKTALKPGHSLMDWIRYGNSGVDLAGTGGRVRPVQHTELATHNKPGDVWMAIRGKVYNVTSYLDFHPGGVDELMRGAGKDATKLFDEVHAWVNYESLLAKCYIGPLRSTGVLKLVPEEPEITSKSPSSSMPPPSPVFLKPPSSSNPSVIVTPSTPAVAPKVLSATSVVSSSSEDSAIKLSPVVPRFDWIQKTAEVTFIFYTKALCNPAVVVEFVNNLEFNVRIFLEGNVLHRYHFQVTNNLQWPCTVRQSLEAGKVELVFNKLLPTLWTNYGQMEHDQIENYPMELHEYDVATRIELTHDSCALLLRPKNNSILQVTPIGHHLSISGTVAEGQAVTRSYTPVPPAAVPTDCPPTFIPLLVKTYPLGALSKHLTRPVPLATSLQISLPSGNFSLAKLKHHNRIALLAAGSGITPMLALLSYLLERSSNKIMPYKVVQTIEDGEICLSVIPSGWESKGILHWPKKHLVNKLSQVESSVPDEKWERMNCVCKREFKTRSEAEAEMDHMENKSDTEIEKAHVMLPPKKKLRNDPPSKSHKTFEPRDFNALITSAAMDLQETEAGTNQDQDVPLDSSIGDQQIILVEPQCTITEGQMTDSSQLIYLNTNSTTSGATGSAELQAIIANQNTIKDNQTKMMKSMANMQTTLNFLVDSVAQNEVPQKVHKQKEPGNEIINPIDCLEDLSNLEKYLDNEYNLQKLSTSMAFICGTSGKAQGIDCCYKLVDYFFTRRFLTQCSWTGAARLTDGNAGQQESVPSTSADVAGKVPLKFFKKTRQLFLNLVMRADKDFSELESEKFFKTVLKNSKQRTTAKTLTSTHKNRPKNLKYKTSKHNDENQPTYPDGGKDEPKEQESGEGEEDKQELCEDGKG